MSKAEDFVKARTSALALRPKVELKKIGTDQPCLFRASKEGNFEFHHCAQFTVHGEAQGDTYPTLEMSPEEALKLAAWIQSTFR